MDERELGGKANADLLMSSKGILPGRKAKECETILFEERLDATKKCSLTRRFDMLYDIVHKNDVEMFAFRLWLLNKSKVLTDKGSLLMELRKESLCFIDASLTDVDASHAATSFSKWKQVSTFATSYFQHLGFVCQREARLYIVQIILTGCVCLFSKILFSI